MSVATVPARLMTPVFADADWVQDFLFSDDGEASDFTGSTFSLTMAPVSGLFEDAGFSIESASGYLFEAGGRISLRVPAAAMADRAPLSYQWRLREHRQDDTVAVLALGVLPINPALNGAPVEGDAPPPGGQGGELTINRDAQGVGIVRGSAGPIGMPGNYAASDFGRDWVQVAAASAGRERLGMGGERYEGEIPRGLEPAAYTAALTALAQACADDNATLWFTDPEGGGEVAGPIEVEGWCNLAFSTGARLVTTGFDDDVFHFHITTPYLFRGQTLSRVSIHHPRNSLLNTASFGLRITGNQPLLNVRIEDFESQGCYAAVVVDMDTFATPAGRESLFSDFDIDVTCHNASDEQVNAKYGVWFRNGTGTKGKVHVRGNLARNGLVDGDINPFPRGVRADQRDENVVVGDIKVTADLTGANAGTFTWDDAMVYQTNIINLAESQSDGAATATLGRYPMGDGPVSGVRDWGNKGGDTDMSGPLGLRTGCITLEQGVGLQMAGGTHRGIPAEGSFPGVAAMGYIEIGKVLLGSPADGRPAGGGKVSVEADGTVQQVGYGTACCDYALGQDGGVATWNPAPNHPWYSVKGDGSPFGGIALDVVPDGLELTFRARAVTPHHGSILHGQISVTGGISNMLTRGDPA
ncbi:hypothetical protein KOAAANKH_00090 [Brevundimonas sp. NIBR10]|uniref:hypothetical protein n=1 Tax=Brevundimonas sp. NIBR10 TaxID=3015997 RepID=UPI0022F1625A|nr:hypothetical protein [Brevundimonas sp. NIBR10]WGM45229.1 hypothetical protein KOAAANKH_00090 [Brevundimonas sp. NIBR10]